MAKPAVRNAHIQDTQNLYADIADGNLPAVSFVKPSGFVDGHPASSKLNLFEGFVKKIVDAVQANKDLWKDTAIIITMDEGGGYYDSGYVQPLDFFGDGTRIPLHRGVQVLQRRPHRAQLFGSRLHPQIHREELGSETRHLPQPGQFPQPDHGRQESLCASERSGDQRLVRAVRLQLNGSKLPRNDWRRFRSPGTGAIFYCIFRFANASIQGRISHHESLLQRLSLYAVLLYCIRLARGCDPNPLVIL